MPEIPDNSVDLICADLPYGITNCQWDVPIDLGLMWDQYKRIAKPNAAIVLFAAQPFTSALVLSQLKLFKYELIWEKTHPNGFLNAKKMPMRAHENILVFYGKPPIYNPQMTTGHARKTSVKKSNPTDVYGKQTFDQVTYDSTERYPRSVQLFSHDRQKSALHSTQKPVDLLCWIIRTYSNKGNTVLDNTMGSGSTGVACLQEGRNFIGMEINKKIYKIACDRLLEERSKLSCDK